MMIDFSKCRLDDAEITNVALGSNALLVTYRDWKQNVQQLAFRGIAGYQWFSPEGKPLSHGTVDKDDEFLTLTRQMAQEDASHNLRVYSFISAWDDSKILRVVATNVEIIAPE